MFNFQTQKDLSNGPVRTIVEAGERRGETPTLQTAYHNDHTLYIAGHKVTMWMCI